ncbi:MAG: hypothetical protein KY397_02630 [Gemmatimonadetes bacterium]|nr:hypothetical protein [Gemmatimonadota bacterium]
MRRGHDLPQLNVRHVLDRMEERPAGWFYGLVVVLAIVGVIGFVAGMLSDPRRAWTALTWNWVFFSGVSVAGAVVAAAATASNGGWIWPIRRFAEGLTAFLPVSFALMIVLFFGIDEVYEWVHHPPPKKAAWLNPTFFVVREVLAVGVLYAFALAMVYWSLRPDLGRLRDRVTGWRGDLYGRLAGGWRGLDVEVERSRVVRSRLAPAVALLYAVLWTVVAWDWLMSIDPHWFSTLFGAWIFMTHFLAALGATAVLACAIRPYRSFADVVGTRSLHDIGKLVFAFTIFWTYLFFAQYLVIWYGRLPEETHFVKERLWEVYQPIATIVLLAVFLVPFLGLLGARPKRTPGTLTAFSVVSLIGIWLFHLLLIAPSVFPEFLAFGWIELSVGAGLFGLFALCYVAFLAAFPSIAIAAGRPMEEEAAEMAETQEPHD